MSVYPDIINGVRSVIPLGWTYDTRVLITRFESEGEEKRRQKWTVRRRRIELNYTFMTPEETRILWQFWLDRKGPLEAFTFFYPNADTYIREFVGVAEGGETYLRLPSKNADLLTSTFSLWRNNSMLIYTTDYSVQLETGPDGEDYAQLYITINPGDRFEWSFTGALAMQMRFEANAFDLELVKAHGSWTVVLQELIHNMTSYG